MIHYWGNVIEGVLWIAIAGTVYATTRKEAGKGLREVSERAAIAFLWFGISDFIEVGTGAWYRPVGLLVMKAACVLVLLHCLATYIAVKRREAERGQGDEEGHS